MLLNFNWVLNLSLIFICIGHVTSQSCGAKAENSGSEKTETKHYGVSSHVLPPLVKLRNLIAIGTYVQLKKYWII